MDVHDRQTRAYNMSQIKGRDTKPELVVRRICHRLGLRFRLHRKDLPGKPDLVFSGRRTVVFVHGCYWHSHTCRYGKVVPKTNTEFWQSKRLKTVERDRQNQLDLEASGWQVLVYWECEIKNAAEIESTIRKDFNLTVSEKPQVTIRRNSHH